ncbi:MULTISPECIES: VOC family protein [Streptomyces]|uniref:VOC family protein n=1 Tax=Streptomyces TaxID=1883 RepID=UPI0030829699
MHDQDEALDFYTRKLGWEVRADVTTDQRGRLFSGRPRPVPVSGRASAGWRPGLGGSGARRAAAVAVLTVGLLVVARGIRRSTR